MNIEIANRLIELRKKSGLSQEELADLLGVSRQAISKWERAEASPDTSNLISLAKIYQISLDELLNIPVKKEETTEIKETEVHQEEKKQFHEEVDVIMALTPFVCVIFYLLIGFFVPHYGWRNGWIIFLLIPLVGSLKAAISRRSFCAFAYPVFVTAIYLVLGMVYHLWHPYWFIFITVPVYYIIFNAVDKKIQK